MHDFLILSQQQITNIIIQYLVQKKVSAVHKNLILAAVRHACEINDVILNWKKIKKFIRSSQKTGNEIAGKDRGYTHAEIQKIVQHCDQRIKTCFLILASTGIRIGALGPMKIGDLERINDLYKMTVYSGEKEQYITFTTPEATKEIDAYLEFRKRRYENITPDSYLIVKKFKLKKTEGFGSGYSLRSILQDNIENSGVRGAVGNKFKRKETPLLHGFRKFFASQLEQSKVSALTITRLLGHDTGLLGRYSKTTEEEILQEYYRAVPLLTISDEERVKFKLAEHIKIDKSRVDRLEESLKKLQQKYKR